MGTAALVAGWGRSQRRASALPANIPGPMNPAGQPLDGGTGDAIGLAVELYLGALGWTDISAYVLYRDSSVLVPITRGRPNESSSIQPQTASFQVNNRDGRFSPRNPNGPYYGLIGRNTQVRISRMQNGIRRYRFCGEVVSWPVAWDVSGTDVWVDVTAAGQLRRLQQGTQTLGSAMYRAYALGEAASLTPVAYWPCEDGTTATSFASGLKGKPAMYFTGTPQLASANAFLCSLPLPVTNGATLTGQVPTGGTWTDNVCRLLLAVPSNGESDGAIIASTYTLGTVKRADFIYRTAGGLQLKGYDAAGSTLFDTGAVGFPTNGVLLRASFALRTSGANITYEIQTMVVGAAEALSFTGTLTTASIGPVTNVVINPGGTLTGTAVGHISVQPVWDSLGDLVSQLQAWYTEAPSSRFTRLCSEQNVNAVTASTAPATLGGEGVTMGYQTSDTLANLLQQVADTQLSLIYEAPDQLALVRHPRVTLYNQGTSYNPQRGLTLDYAQNQFSGPLNPVDDDAYTRNDVTVQAISGSFAQATLASGALSTQAPPNGVGDYATTYSLSLGNLAISLDDHAHWRLHMGTVDEPRFPSIALNLRHPQFTGNVDLLNQALTLDIGDLVVIDNPPAWMAPDPIRLIVQGYTESMGVFEHDMVLNCSPEAPYRVGIVGDAVLGAADTDGSTLAAPLGPVLNPNGFFTGGGIADWTGTRSTLTAAGTSGSANPLPAGGPTGHGILLTPLATGATAAKENGPGGPFPCAPGQVVFVSGLVYAPLGYSQVTIGFDFLDGGGGILASSTATAAVSAGVWTALSTSQTAPAGTVSAAARVGQAGAPAVTDLLYAACVVAWQGAVSVASTNILLPLWTTSASAFPFDIAVSAAGGGGERMTVTGVTGGASPQAFTVARGVNGVAPAQPAGRDVRLWQPSVVSL